MQTVLVTGASGFIGGYLVEALARQGCRVRCLVRETSSIELLQSLDVELAYGDVLSGEALQQAVSGVDVVYHVAGLTRALRTHDFHRVNADGVDNVARACAAQDRPPVHVLLSSVAAAGPVRRSEVRDETQLDAPVSHYGRSKRAGELAAEKWARQVPTTIIRPGIVFGPRNRDMLPMFQTIRRLRMHPVAGWATPPLSLIHVDDLVEIMLLAARRGVRIDVEGAGNGNGRRGYYFACDEEHLDYVELGRLVRPMLQRPFAPMIYLVPPLPWLLAGVSEVASRVRGRPDVIGLDKMREATVQSWACSPGALRRDLDFQPSKTLKERFRETVAWYFEAGWI